MPKEGGYGQFPDLRKCLVKKEGVVFWEEGGDTPMHAMYTCVPKIRIIWGMIPEICSETSNVWFLRYGVRQTKFFIILGHFFPFYPTNNLKNQNFEKMKKTPRAIINLHKCTKNWNNLIPEIWCVTNVSSIFHFGLFFALLSAPKKQKFLKIKKRLTISFCTCVQKIMITWCMVPEI